MGTYIVRRTLQGVLVLFLVSARPKVFWYNIVLYSSKTIRYVKLIVKGCTKTTFDPLRAASNLTAEASCAR